MDYSKIKKIILWTDTHVGAPHADIPNIDPIIEDYLKYKEDETVLVVATGDIIDNKNVPRKKAKHWAEERDNLKKLMGKNYLFGNHECEVDPDGYFAVFGDILIFHDHMYSWCGNFTEPCKKVLKWESKREGLRWHKYFAYRFKHLVVKRGKKLKPSEKMISDLVSFANSQSAKKVLFGHTHKLYDEIHQGIRIINGGRGRTVYIL